MIESAKKPRVFNKSRDLPTGCIYVGRPSQWGNPYKISKSNTRTEVIERFEQYAKHKLKETPNWLEPLRGKDLLCWCAPKPCHADILLRLANEK